MKRILLSAVLALGAIIPTSLITSATPASATCNGVGSNHVIVTSIGAEQVRYASTCDGDGFYAGQAYDAVTDGFCVAVRYRQHGTSGAGTIQGQACTTGAFSNYNAQGGPFDVRLCKGASTATSDCTAWVVSTGF